jgi:hypothetical protein
VIDYITIEVQLGDILTKALGHVRFEELRARISVDYLLGDPIKAYGGKC